MKIPVRIVSLTCLFLGIFLLAGCNTVSVNSHQYIGGPTYAATVPDQIQILRTMPNRSLEKLGEITVSPDSDSTTNLKIEQAFQKSAAAMGANAVVITSDSEQVTGAMVTGPWYGRTVQRTTARVVVGVAIRYTGK
jgi:hypothetical protein